jgi:hypothetical protein
LASAKFQSGSSGTAKSTAAGNSQENHEYSRFTLSNLRCIPSNVKLGESIEVSVTANNDSQVDGEATLFLFVRDVVASVSRP